MACPNCRRKSRSTTDYCLYCAAPLHAGLPRLTPVTPNEWFAVLGGVLLTISVFALLSPLLLVFLYGAFLVLPLYLGAAIWVAIRNAGICQSLCRVRRGAIPLQSWLGYTALCLCLMAWIVFMVASDRDREAKRQAIQAQYGPLYYPGAEPDRDSKGNLRTGDSFGDVARFYKASPLCDDRRGWYGGGEYLTFCKRSERGSAVRFKITSRVDNNEPYVLIGFEP